MSSFLVCFFLKKSSVRLTEVKGGADGTSVALTEVKRALWEAM